MGHSKHKIYISITLLLISFAVQAQDFATIYGKIVDAATGYELPYASVSLKNSSITNVANADGGFSLKVPQTAFDDSLIISYLGFRNRILPVSHFIGKRNVKVKLAPTSMDIRSITVRTGNATDLFLSAFSSRYIRANYPVQPVGMCGFYRETIRKGNRYISLSEAVVDILKHSYTAVSNDNVAIYKGRGSTNRNASDTLFMQLQGGPVTSLQLDIVKNPFVGVGVLSAPDFYKFTMGPVFTMDSLNIYTIDFDQVPEVGEVLFKGRIFIESQSLAVVKIEFEMNVSKDPESWRHFVRRKPDDVQIAVEWAKYQVNYKQHGSKWYMDYSRADLRFAAKYKGKLLKNKYDITTELAVTDINNTSAFNISPSQRFRMKDMLQKEVASFANGSFWENANIIEPDEKIENIINRIVKQLKKERNGQQ